MRCRKNWMRLFQKGEFNFICCSIRHFESYIDLIEQHQNFVFATEGNSNKLAIFLLDEKDLENDEETMKTIEMGDIDGKIVQMKFIASDGQRDINQLVCVSVNPF